MGEMQINQTPLQSYCLMSWGIAWIWANSFTIRNFQHPSATERCKTMLLVLVFISNQQENCSAATSPATVLLQKTQANSVSRQLGKQTCASSSQSQPEGEQLGCKPDWWRKHMQGSISADLVGIWTHSLKWPHRGHCEEMGLGKKNYSKNKFAFCLSRMFQHLI